MLHNEFPKAFGQRLKKERIKLGLNQTEFSEMGGIQRLAQGAYEQGKRLPNVEYLASIMAHNADAIYLLTGKTSQGTTTEKLNKSIILPVATAALEWLNTTEREITPQLFADVLTVLYDAAAMHYDEEHMADQLKAII